MKIPEKCPANLSDLIQRCWQQEPSDRPSESILICPINLGFSEILDLLSADHIARPSKNSTHFESDTYGIFKNV
jgi:hypothetical protein